MTRSAIPAVARVCRHCGATWFQRDGQPPRDYCTASCRQEAERAQRGLVAVPSPADEPAAPLRCTRQVRAKTYTITCGWCGEVVTLEQYPGPAPRYCSAACRAEATRAAAAERMRRMRARDRAQPSADDAAPGD